MITHVLRYGLEFLFLIKQTDLRHLPSVNNDQLNLVYIF
jgi:hypothetical protein